MFSDCQDSGQLPKNQCVLNKAPYPLEPAASEVISYHEADILSSRKNVRTFYCSKNDSQTIKSLLASLFKRILKWGLRIPLVRSISLRKKALPGKTTEHVKFKRPIND